jgi:hypothetical protein
MNNNHNLTITVQRYEEKWRVKSEKRRICWPHWSFLTYIKKLAAPFGAANFSLPLRNLNYP